MNIRSEGAFQKWVRDTLKHCNCEVLNVNGHGMQAAGWPDLYFAHGIIAGWLELKYESGKLTPLQEHRLGRLREKGIMAVTLRCDRGGWISIDEVALVKIHHGSTDPRDLVAWLADSWQKLRIIEMTRKQNE